MNNFIDLKILVVVPAGINTLHESWINIKDKNIKDKNVDFVVFWYSDEDVPEKIIKNSMLCYRQKSSKWVLIKDALNKIKWTNYDYIWFPDDDLLKIKGSVELLCKTMYINDIHLAQPSLLDINVQWKPLLHIESNMYYHETNFIEIQAPCFSKASLLLLLETIIDKDIKSGWGLDYVWSTLLKKCGLRIGVIDNVVMEHTRPSKKQDKNYQGGGINPYDELKNTLEKYSIRKYIPKITHYTF